MRRNAARILLSVIGAVIGATFLSAGAALAYWATTDSSHPAQAMAATLATPAAGTQNGTATPTTVPIKWTAPTGYTSAGYTVLRCSGSSCTNFTAISNGTCSGTITGTSCTDTDTGLSAGTTYSYEVEAHLANWVSSPGSSFHAATSTLTQLVFTTQPSSNQNIQATGTGSFSVAVTIEDANGNKASHDNSDTVTLAIASAHNPGGGTLSCTGGLTATASSGVASFTGCAITKAGSGYQLTASSATDSALTAPANANSFNITAGNASQVAATSGAGQSATADAAFTNPLVATVQDANGNPVPGVSVTFAGPSTGASVSFGSTGCTSNPHTYSCVATSGSNGQATSSAFTANTKLGTYTISASVTGLTSASFSESNIQTAITSLVTANGGGGTAGKLNAGDTITITFSGQIDASKVCSGWTNGSTGTQSTSNGSTITVNNTASNGDDVLSFSRNPFACGTFNFGSIDLGSSQYVTSPGNSHQAVTFSNSTISYNGTTHTLQITLGSMGGSGTENVVPSSALTLSLSTSVLDTGDNALSAYTYTTASGQQF
jgi:trimeric autotransporter adhesin